VKYGIRQRNVFAILIATAALGIGLSGLEQLWQPRVRTLSPDTGTWFLGLLSAGYFLAAAGGSALSTMVLKLFRQRYRFVLFSFRLLMAVLYVALAFALNLGAFTPLYFLLFFAHGITGSPEMTVFNRDIPANKRSSLLSLNSLFLQAGGALGSLAAGQIAMRHSIPAAWMVSGGLLAASAFAYFFIKENII
jgi:predicted MFS family arabinose efflux permease